MADKGTGMGLDDFHEGEDDVWWDWPAREAANRRRGTVVGSGRNKGPGEVTAVARTGKNKGKVKVRWADCHTWIVPHHLRHVSQGENPA